MAFKMKGFNPGKGTGMAKNLAAKAGKSTAKSVPYMAEMVTEKMLNRTMQKYLKKKTAEYTPQTKSRKDISTDITPQTQKDKKAKEVNNWVKRAKKIQNRTIKQYVDLNSPMKKNGKQDKKVPAIPTKEEGSDAWRANFLKRHKVTNDQVNNEIYKIGGGEDDVDFDDWKRVVLSLSKNKKAHQADWEPEFIGGDN